MAKPIQPDRESERTYRRLLPRLERELSTSIAADPQGWQDYTARLHGHFPTLFQLYLSIYGSRYDFFFHLEMRASIRGSRGLARDRSRAPSINE